MLLFIFAERSWEMYVLGGVVIVLSIAVCVLMLYIIAKKTNCVEKAELPVLETEGDKNRKQPPSVRPEALEEIGLKIQSVENSGWEIIDTNTKERVGFSETKEDANQILLQLAKTQKTKVPVQNRKGQDGEMVSYVNDKNMELK